MFENESNKVREDIEYLQGLMESDSQEEPESSLDEIRERLEDIQEDMDFLMSNLPYEVLGDIDDEREDTGEDLLEEGELEDEVVEADRLIEDAKELLFSVREKYFGDEIGTPSTPSEPKDTGKAEKRQEEKRPKKMFRVSLDLFLAIAIFIILILSCILG